jgi:DNA-binding CsgD family transcriptional regulator
MYESFVLYESDYSTYDIMGDAIRCGDVIEEFANEHSITNQMENSIVQSKRQELFNIVMEVAKERLTTRQIEILTLFLGGLTQYEIGEKLGIHQTSVHKALYGSIDYSRSKRYGGIVKKLRKYCGRNNKILNLLKEIKLTKGKFIVGGFPRKKFIIPGIFNTTCLQETKHLKLSSGQDIVVGIANESCKKAYIYKRSRFDNKAEQLLHEGYDVIELCYNGKIIAHTNQGDANVG